MRHGALWEWLTKILVDTLVNQGRVFFFIRLEPDRNTGIIASFTDAEKFTRRHGDLFQPCADLVVLGIVVQVCDFKPGLRFIVPLPRNGPLPFSSACKLFPTPSGRAWR